MIQQKCIESYARLKNLKLVGEEVGIRWQSVYVHLKKAGVKVTGDKARPSGRGQERRQQRCRKQWRLLKW